MSLLVEEGICTYYFSLLFLLIVKLDQHEIFSRLSFCRVFPVGFSPKTGYQL
jgi:hypothetical protein